MRTIADSGKRVCERTHTREKYVALRPVCRLSSAGASARIDGIPIQAAVGDAESLSGERRMKINLCLKRQAISPRCSDPRQITVSILLTIVSAGVISH